MTLATMPAVAYQRLPAVLAAYAGRYPGNRVMLLERSGALATEAVRRGDAEFDIHILQEPWENLAEDLLSADPLVLVCHPTHPLATRASVSWAELQQDQLITLGGSSGNRALVETQLSRAGLPRRGCFVVENSPSAMALAVTGVAVAVLSSATGRGLLPGALVEVPLVEPVPHRRLGLVRRRREALTQRPRHSIACCCRHSAAPVRHDPATAFETGARARLPRIPQLSGWRRVIPWHAGHSFQPYDLARRGWRDGQPRSRP
ncbi:LysR substrate-binding domain-containing protein [Roseomonas sp. GCM10028921]